MLYLLFKIINPVTRIGVSNLKYKIEKATLLKYRKNITNIIENMSATYNIIIGKVGCHEYYMHHIFRDILSLINSTFYHFIEIYKNKWDTGTYIEAE